MQLGLGLNLTQPRLLARRDQRTRDLQHIGGLLDLILGQRDAAVGDLGRGIGARQFGRKGQAPFDSACLRHRDTRIPGGDPCRALAPQLDRLIDLKRRLLLVASVTAQVADEILAIEIDRGIGSRASLFGFAKRLIHIGVERRNAWRLAGFAQELCKGGRGPRPYRTGGV